MTKDIELLSPAGNVESLRAAVQNGADAVYFGGKSFGARQFADNFGDEDMARAIDYCHVRGVKAYLTVNTLVSDREFKAFERFIRFARECGADAFIVQDMGAASLIFDIAPDVPVHASTQTTVHNLDGARLLKRLGFKRLVLPRELPAEQVKAISLGSGLETELFVHGAICVCYSGQCLMSSIIGRRSGNRGRCAQPCRLPYTLLAGGRPVTKGYLLNPKDLCLVELLDKIKECGVKSLKVEGRMKGAEYVAAVTAVYRRYLDQGGKVSAKDIELLKNEFSRGGFTQGFFGGARSGLIRLQRSNEDVYRGKRYAAFSDTYGERANLRRRPIKGFFRARLGEKPVFIVDCAGITASVTGSQPAQQATGRALTREQVLRQLEKTGHYPFAFEYIDVDMDDGLFMPVSALNALRRDALQRLDVSVAGAFKRQPGFNILRSLRPAVRAEEPVLAAQADNAGQAEALLKKGICRLYLPVDALGEIGRDQRVIPVFPDIIHDSHMRYYEDKLCEARRLGYDAIFTGNLGIISKALEMGLKVWGSAALNIFNARAAAFYADMGLAGAEVSRELNMSQVRGLVEASPLLLEVMVYGRITLMTTANCAIKTSCGICRCENGKCSLKDRKGEEFPLLGDKRLCLNRLLNSKPVYAADMLGEMRKSGIYSLKMTFTVENPTECDKIYMTYRDALAGRVPPTPDFAFTRGHLTRGVV